MVGVGPGVVLPGRTSPPQLPLRGGCSEILCSSLRGGRTLLERKEAGGRREGGEGGTVGERPRGWYSFT